MREYIIELEKDVWLAEWKGDPGRTLKIENAQKYTDLKEAQSDLIQARTYRPFKKAKILQIKGDMPKRKPEGER